MKYYLLKRIFALFLVCQAADITSIHAETTEIEKLRDRVIKDALYEKGFLPRRSRYIIPAFGKTEIKIWKIPNR